MVGTVIKGHFRVFSMSEMILFSLGVGQRDRDLTISALTDLGSQPWK